MSINKTTTDLSTLKINYLTQEMYENALENNEINENELYVTPGREGGGGAVDATSIPTANKIAKFDTEARMNSEDMSSTEVNSFVNNLDYEFEDEYVKRDEAKFDIDITAQSETIDGDLYNTLVTIGWDDDVINNGMLNQKALNTKILGAKLLVAKGTESNGVSWKKYSDGTCELFYDTGFSLNTGTAWCGGYYHKTTYGLVLPSWVSNLRLISATKADGTLAWCVGLALESDGYHFYWMTGSNASASGSNFMATHLTFTGTWQ